MHRRFLLRALLLLALLFPLPLRAQPQPPSATVFEDTTADPAPAPDFVLTTLDGETIRPADLRGKVVVLNFWATWCAPCRDEIPGFVALQEELRDRGLLFVGAAVDEPDAEAVARFAQGIGINYPVGLDDGSIARAYAGISILPTTFVIDRAGALRGYAPGMLTRDAIRPLLEKLLEEDA